MTSLVPGDSRKRSRRRLSLHEKSRCSRLSSPAVPYMSQKNAWADTVTFRRWFTSCFIPFIRRHTSAKVALVMDNCGPHNADLWDSYDQVPLLTLPPNCTSVFQPMDMGVIQAFKLRYRRILLGNISTVLEERTALREASKKRKLDKRSIRWARSASSGCHRYSQRSMGGSFRADTGSVLA